MIRYAIYSQFHRIPQFQPNRRKLDFINRRKLDKISHPYPKNSVE